MTPSHSVRIDLINQELATTLFNPTHTIIGQRITDVTAMLDRMASPAAHRFPYRVFAPVDATAPYYASNLVLVHRDGAVFVVRPHAEERVVSPQDDASLWETLEHVVVPWKDWVELHPTRAVVFPTKVDGLNITRTPSDYFAALRAALRMKLRLERSIHVDAIVQRLDQLAAQAAQRVHGLNPNYRQMWEGRWRGVSVDRGRFLALRAVFKDPAFIETYKEAVVDAGDYGPLKDYLNDCGCDWFFNDSWLREMTGGVLMRADCGHVEFFDDTVTTQDGNHTYCRGCADEEFVYVEACRQHEVGWYHHDDVYYWESDGEYHLEPEPEPEDECDDDDDECGGLLCSWSESTSRLDHDRSFVPSSYGDFTIGIELEVETADYDRYDAVWDCHHYFNCDGRYAMFKRDGSLDGARGFEIVTAARRLGDHLEMFKDWTPYEGLRSWSAGCCGMHVHIDSRAFTALSLGKFLQFFNDPANARFIRSIAGRHPDMDGQAKSYAARVECDNPNPARIKKGAGTSRYRMVNLTNLTASEKRRLAVATSRESKGSYSTVELRIFRGTLKKERLLAQIEFAHAAAVFCRVAGIHQLNGPGFISWLGSVSGQYKHLARWFGVYVPRPTKQRPAPAPATPDASCAAGV